MKRNKGECEMSAVLLETKSLTKKFGKETAVSDVSLTVQKTAFMVCLDQMELGNRQHLKY